jgi:hypothetical protein
VVVVVVVRRGAGGEADLEGEIRLGSEELHRSHSHSLSLRWSSGLSRACVSC